MRELSIINSTAEDENRIFDVINELARNCQFSNCDHEKSKGCAVLPEIENGHLPERQFKNYQKIQKERLSSSDYSK
jgi:ribosome biogenesis GTPase